MNNTARSLTTITGVMVGLVVASCATPRPALPERPSVRPAASHAHTEVLPLDASQITAMYTEMVPIDLATVLRLATDNNFDVQRSRQDVVAAEGRFESAVGAAFPAIVPTGLFTHVEGTVRATPGSLVGVGFNTFQPSVAVQWVLNPGRVVYDILAARKRLWASEDEADGVLMETLRRATVEFYALVLAQARVAAVYQSVEESNELLRINRLRTETGTGVPADELRAEANLAQRQQDLALALNQFYNASVALTLSLHLDATVTLVPQLDELPAHHLVREDLSIEELLGFALAFRPDLQQVRILVEAVAAEKGSTWWGAFGPELAVSYQYGGISGDANNVVDNSGIPGNLIVNPVSPTGAFHPNPLVNGMFKEGVTRGSDRIAGSDDQTFGWHDQQRGDASIGWRLSVSAFGNLKSADARHRRSVLRAEQKLDEVRAQVVKAAQASKTHRTLIGLAVRRVKAAHEALRLTEANLQAGAMTTLDVLQAQDALTKARLSHASAVVQYNQSQVNLLASLGLLNSNSLAEDTSSSAASTGEES